MGYKMLRLLKHKTNTNTYKKQASVRLISQTCLYHAIMLVLFSSLIEFYLIYFYDDDTFGRMLIHFLIMSNGI